MEYFDTHNTDKVLIQKIIDHINLYPNDYDQSHFGKVQLSRTLQWQCQTPCCIAGLAIVVSENPGKHTMWSSRDDSVSEIGKELLALPYDITFFLFSDMSKWPETWLPEEKDLPDSDIATHVLELILEDQLPFP